jgi:hypothetical protein
MPALSVPAAPLVDVVREVPGAYLRVGTISPSVVAASATGDVPWLVTFTNPRQGDDLKGFSFAVKLSITGAKDTERQVIGTLRPARYFVASLTVVPAQDTVLQARTRTLSFTARDSSSDVLTDSLLLGRRPVWSSGTGATATVGSSSGVVTGIRPGTVTISAELEGGRASASVIVLPDVTGTYTLKSLNGKSIPGETYSDSTYVINTTGGTLTLRADKTFSFGVGATGRNRSASSWCPRPARI